MMKKISKILFIMFVVFLMIVPKSLAAKNDRITDETGELTQDELAELNQLANTYSENHQADICVAIVSSTRGYSIDDYANKIYEDYDYGIGDNYDGILLTIDMDSRTYYMTNDKYGKCFNYITDYSMGNLGDDFVSDYSNYGIYDAVKNWIKSVDSLLTSGEGGQIVDVVTETIEFIVQDENSNYVDARFDVYDSDGNYWDSIYCSNGKGQVEIEAGQKYTGVCTYIDDSYEKPENIVFSVNSSPINVKVTKEQFHLGDLSLPAGVAGGSGLVGALVYTGILKGKNKSVRRKYDATSYLRKDSFILNDRRDTFLYSHVSKTPRPKDNDRGGSSHSSHHSGGSSFSGSSGSRSGGRGGGHF